MYYNYTSIAIGKKKKFYIPEEIVNQPYCTAITTKVPLLLFYIYILFYGNCYSICYIPGQWKIEVIKIFEIIEISKTKIVYIDIIDMKIYKHSYQLTIYTWSATIDLENWNVIA